MVKYNASDNGFNQCISQGSLLFFLSRINTGELHSCKSGCRYWNIWNSKWLALHSSYTLLFCLQLLFFFFSILLKLHHQKLSPTRFSPREDHDVQSPLAEMLTLNLFYQCIIISLQETIKMTSTTPIQPGLSCLPGGSQPSQAVSQHRLSSFSSTCAIEDRFRPYFVLAHLFSVLTAIPKTSWK